MTHSASLAVSCAFTLPLWRYRHRRVFLWFNSAGLCSCDLEEASETLSKGRPVAIKFYIKFDVLFQLRENVLSTKNLAREKFNS